MVQTRLDDKDAELLIQVHDERLESADYEDIKRLTLAGLIHSERGRLTLTRHGNQTLLEWILWQERRKK